MRVVEDQAGHRHLLVKRSGDASLVRDLETGEERYVPSDELTAREGIDPLDAAAATIDPALRQVMSAVHDDRGIGLLVTLAAGDRAATALLSATSLCESDLVGHLSELRAAGLVVETTVGGEPGYAATDAARRAVAALQSETPDDTSDD